ncbi:MAG: SGNH/GDSL hydrolase family protein, partial [Armatimonadetes bacterium]|nr:SGNH/GDSL hydrolase family protein [Armatimonadota bacterium]
MPDSTDTLATDSPVVFPTDQPIPAKYPCDLPAENHPPEPDYFLFNTPERSLEQIRTIQAEMPPGTFTPPPHDWAPLRRARRLLTEGGDFHLLGLGDSIVNDTMRSGWVGLLQEAYPEARVRGTVYVRGAGGCQHYKEEDRVAKVVVPLQPDVVYIGGISQADLESIRDVIGQLRAGLPEVEILLATGTFGRADPRDPAALAAAPYSGTGPWGAG